MEIVQISYARFREEFELKLEKEIKECNFSFMQQKVYMEAVEDVFEAFGFELKRSIRSKQKNKSRVSEIEFEQFYKNAKNVFVKKAKAYADPLEQKAYLNGAIKAVNSIRLFLITLYSKKGEVQSNVKKPVPNLCIVWN